MRESRLQFFLLALAALYYPITERWLQFWQLNVDYPFLVLFWVAIRKGHRPGVLFGFALGLLRDMSDFSQIGATALAFSVGGFAVGKMRDKIDRESLPARLLLLVAGYLLTQAVFLLARSGWSPAAGAIAWARYALPSSLLNAAVYGLSLLIVELIREGLALLNEPLARR